MVKTKGIDKILEKFDKLFIAQDDRLMHDKYAGDDIKTFLRKELSDLVREERKAVIREIEKVKMKSEGDYIKISGTQWYLIKNLEKK